MTTDALDTIRERAVDAACWLERSRAPKVGLFRENPPASLRTLVVRDVHELCDERTHLLADLDAMEARTLALAQEVEDLRRLLGTERHKQSAT